MRTPAAAPGSPRWLPDLSDHSLIHLVRVSLVDALHHPTLPTQAVPPHTAVCPSCAREGANLPTGRLSPILPGPLHGSFGHHDQQRPAVLHQPALAPTGKRLQAKQRHTRDTGIQASARPLCIPTGNRIRNQNDNMERENQTSATMAIV